MLQTKNTVGAILIYVGSGLIYGKHLWIGLPLTLIGSLCIGYVNAKIGLSKIK